LIVFGAMVRRNSRSIEALILRKVAPSSRNLVIRASAACSASFCTSRPSTASNPKGGLPHRRVVIGVRPRLSRRNKRLTCSRRHLPCPLGVGIRRSLSAAAKALSVLTPLARNSAMMGAKSAARLLARAARSLLPAARAFAVGWCIRQLFTAAARRPSAADPTPHWRGSFTPSSREGH
jgi:hypothetical protein